MLSSNSLSIVIPALNEARNLKRTITDLMNTLTTRGIEWEIILVDDGSRDETANLADSLASGEARIKVIHHLRPMGIGCCFRDGLRISNKSAITWLPAEGENDPNELIKYFNLLEQVDIIVPFVLNTSLRSLYRRILSKLYVLIINISFGTRFNYTNGNVIYRRKVFDIIKCRSNGFFFQTECLVKAIHSGFDFVEVPVRLRKRISEHSKAVSLKSFCNVVYEFSQLIFKIHLENNR